MQIIKLTPIHSHIPILNAVEYDFADVIYLLICGRNMGRYRKLQIFLKVGEIWAGDAAIMEKIQFLLSYNLGVNTLHVCYANAY